MVQLRKRRRPATPRQAAARKAPIDTLLDPALFKALADPTRCLLLSCIAKCGRGCTVGEIAECCSVDLSVVSRHLTVLFSAGVLDSAKSGRTVRYTVRHEQIGAKLRQLAGALEQCCSAEGEIGCGDGCC